MNRDHLFEDVLCVIGASNERPRKHPTNPQGAANLAKLGEFVRVIVLLDLGVPGRGPEILSNRQDIDACFDRIVHQRDDFFFFFPETNHDSRLDER